MYAASSSVSAPPRPHRPAARRAADRTSTPHAGAPAPGAADRGGAGGRRPAAQRETRLVRPAGRPAAHGDRLGAPDLPGVQPGPGAAPQRPFRPPGRHHRPHDGGRQVSTGPLPRLGGAVPARNSGLPRVRPAPSAGPGAAADRRRPGELHAGHRADARPGGGAARGIPSEAPPRADVRAALGAICRVNLWRPPAGLFDAPLDYAGPASPATTSWGCSPTGIWATCRSCCTASRTRAAGRAWGSSATATRCCPTSCCPRPARCWSTGSTRAGTCRATTWRRCGRCSATPRRRGARSASSPRPAGPAARDAFLVNLMLVLTREIRTYETAVQRTMREPAPAERAGASRRGRRRRGAAAAAAPAARRLRAARRRAVRAAVGTPREAELRRVMGLDQCTPRRPQRTVPGNLPTRRADVRTLVPAK